MNGRKNEIANMVEFCGPSLEVAYLTTAHIFWVKLSVLLSMGSSLVHRKEREYLTHLYHKGKI